METMGLSDAEREHLERRLEADPAAANATRLSTELAAIDDALERLYQGDEVRCLCTRLQALNRT